MSAKKGTSNSILKAGDSTAWIDPGAFGTSGIVKLRVYLDCFVARSEAIGVTKLTRGFIDDLRVNQTGRANNLIDKLGLGSSIKLKTFKSASKLSEQLISEHLDKDDFYQGNGEFAYYLTVGAAATSGRVKRLPEFDHKKRGTRRKVKPNKTQYYRIDSLFRHLRNAFAHGQVRRFDSEGAIIWALQDANTRGSVTSRMCLKESSLDEWVSLIEARRSKK